jgi:hypothetical protein
VYFECSHLDRTECTCNEIDNNENENEDDLLLTLEIKLPRIKLERVKELLKDAFKRTNDRYDYNFYTSDD